MKKRAHTTNATGKTPMAFVVWILVPVVGVEPTRYCYQRILSFRDNPEPATL